MISRQSGIPLFKIFGIAVFLHWSWFLVGAYEIQARQSYYDSLAWNIAEYLALFVIVLLHEFGHALACRSVGGKADRIMLWPLGGVAYVSPPPRPGAVLWSIAAGPLVNVALLPITMPLMWLKASPDLHHFLWTIGAINILLLAFNLLPIYPLDGGQILQALLWFVMGRAKSLMVCAIIGILGAAALAGVAIWSRNYLLGAIAAYAAFRAYTGIQLSRILRHHEKIPRRAGFACPRCKAAPPMGGFWKCGKCQHPFDTFQTSGICPTCGSAYRTASCPSCGAQSPLSAWSAGPSPLSPPPFVPAPPVPSPPLPPIPPPGW